MENCLIAQHLPLTVIFDSPEPRARGLSLTPRDGNFRLRSAAIPAVHELMKLITKEIRFNTPVEVIYTSLIEAIIFSACYRAPPPKTDQRPDTWTRFLTEAERYELEMMKGDMDFLFARFASGDLLLSAFELTLFRREFNLVTRTLEKKGEARLNALLAKESRSQGLCWKLLKKLNNPDVNLSADPEILLDHFKGIYFKENFPLYFENEFSSTQAQVNAEDDPLNDPFTEGELVAGLKRLNGGAATGPQGISSRSLKEVFASEAARIPLLILFNYCFVSGTVPDAWREGELFVLHKGGPKDIPDNFRGICLLNDFRRLFERLLDVRFLSWISRTQAMGPMQFGFKAFTSTYDAILVLKAFTGYMTRVRRLPVFSAFVDLKKAFPSVNRWKMLSAFRILKVPCRLISSFASLLSGNTNRLRMNFNLTDPFSVNVGVGEGSINSPSCFNVTYFYILEKLNIHPVPLNPVDYRDDVVYYIIFADDLTLFGCDIRRVESAVNDLIPALAEFNMCLNKAKTKWMPFLPLSGCSVSVRKADWAMKVDGCAIECVDRFKFLGFWLDPYLSDSIHVSVICSRLKQAANAWGSTLQRLKCNNLASLRSYFSAFVTSQLYGHIFVDIDLGNIQDAIGTFVRKVFSLPSSFPSSVAEAILGLSPYQVSCFDQRVLFFRRITGNPESVTFGAYCVDRCDLMRHDTGISFIFGDSLARLSLPRFSDPEDVLIRSIVAENSLDAFKCRLIRSEASVFWSQLEVDGRIPPEFANVISDLPYESARIVLLFLGNMLRWSALLHPSELCFLCSAKLYSTHFFACRELRTSSSLSDFSSAITARNFGQLRDIIFITLKEWSDAYPAKFRFRFRWNIQSFFDCEDARVSDEF